MLFPLEYVKFCLQPMLTNGHSIFSDFIAFENNVTPLTDFFVTIVLDNI